MPKESIYIDFIAVNRFVAVVIPFETEKVPTWEGKVLERKQKQF